MTGVFCSFPPPRLPSRSGFGCVTRFGNIQEVCQQFCSKPENLARRGAEGPVFRYPAQPLRFLTAPFQQLGRKAKNATAVFQGSATPAEAASVPFSQPLTLLPCALGLTAWLGNELSLASQKNNQANAKHLCRSLFNHPLQCRLLG